LVTAITLGLGDPWYRFLGEGELRTLEEKMEKLRELTDTELDFVTGGTKPNQNAGGGPGNSGPGDKNSPVEGPPPSRDH
jgi:hypothetical protein